MKKLLLPLAIAAALPVTAMAAGETGVAIYGKINLTALNTALDGKSGGASFDEDDTAKLTSNSSRLGFKGKTKINDSLNVIYKAEFQMYVDDGAGSNSDALTQRNIYVGLQGDFGTVIGGKHDTPLKLSQGKVDQFGDLVAAEFDHVLLGDNRVNNIIMYSTPKMGGFSATVATALGEGSSEDKAGGGSDEHDGLFDAMSVSLNYKADNYFVNLAADKAISSKLTLLPNIDDDVLGDSDPTGDASGDDIKYQQRTDTIRLTGGVNLGDLQLAAMYQTAENSNETTGNDNAFYDNKDWDFEGYLVSAAYKMDQWTLKAQYAINDAESELSSTGAKTDYENSLLALGVDYKLAKTTKVFAYYSNVEYEEDSATADNDAELEVVALGLEHKF